MKKILYVASKVKLHVNLFHVPFLKQLKKEGYEVHVCANNDYENKDDCKIDGCDKFYDIPFHRIPVHLINVKAFFKLRKIIRQNNYDIIHCHTPVGGALARLVSASQRKKGTKVIYTAHGFHFFKNAPLINWLLYYPAEKLLARYTDLIITINKEDYNRVNNWKSAKCIQMNGVGIDSGSFHKFTQEERQTVRKKLGIPLNSIVLLCVAEMSKRKHQDFLINVISKSVKPEMKIHLLLAGEGKFEDQYKELAEKNGLLSDINFLGFREDIEELMGASDIYVSSSRQEGLPVSIMEAMAAGLPVVCFKIRGNNDLIDDGKEIGRAHV